MLLSAKPAELPPCFGLHKKGTISLCDLAKDGGSCYPALQHKALPTVHLSGLHPACVHSAAEFTRCPPDKARRQMLGSEHEAVLMVNWNSVLTLFITSWMLETNASSHLLPTKCLPASMMSCCPVGTVLWHRLCNCASSDVLFPKGPCWLWWAWLPAAGSSRSALG